jgi:hypothetical protein
VLLINVSEWLLIFENLQGVLLYCSDVSGAFDKVPSSRMQQKLFLSGIHPKLFRLVSNWLEGRESAVVVKGSESEWQCITDQVLQGTVLGPLLWNLYFFDIEEPSRNLVLLIRLLPTT